MTVCVYVVLSKDRDLSPTAKAATFTDAFRKLVYLRFTLVLLRAHALEIRTNDIINKRKTPLFTLVTFEVLSPYANVYFLLITVSVYAY